MKKRILALALTGTTAFSVFSGAISVNAATSTDVYFDVDAYMSYEPVATEIEVSVAGASSTQITYYYRQADNGADIGDEIGDLSDLEVVYKETTTIKDNYTKVTYVITTESNGPVYVSDDGNYIVGTPGTGTLAKTTDYLALLGIKETTDGNYQISDTNFIYTDLKDAVNHVRNQNDSDTPENDVYYVYSGARTDESKAYTESEYHKAIEDGSLLSVSDYKDKYIFSNSQTIAGEGETFIKVNDETYTNWAFDSDLTGEDAVEPYEVSTKIEDGKIAVEKEETPTVYAYDFLPYNSTSSSASTIAKNWNNHDLDDAAASLVPYNYSSDETYVMDAETGRGVDGIGIRYDVVSEWEDFLYELAIGEYGYSESWDDFCDNYSDMFYDDPYYDPYTGQQVGTHGVDLYNIEGLLEDIWALKEAEDYYDANTSELIYLMQQYDKYIGDYIDKTEVDTSDWGELLLTVLNSVNEDDFKRSTDYKKYMNEVEDLEDAYESATTVAQIANAEEGMYDLLVSTPYTASSSADTDSLTETLKGLYFNVGSAPETYTTAPSTQSSNVEFYNYNYYIAVLKYSGSSVTDSGDLAFSSTLAKGYYSLYPMIDYIDDDSSTPNKIYSGNENSDDDDFEGAYATEEYEWFWNVYQLAARMNDDNSYQGAIDAVNDALSAAVTDLAVTTTPYSSEVAAVEDMMDEYAGKIETDYDEDYYANYAAAYDYAENVAEGRWQTRIASYIVGVSGEALTYQGTQNTVTKTMISELEDSIDAGETALAAIENSDEYNAAQVNALNKAISDAQDIIDLYEGSYSTSKTYQSVNKNYSALVGDKDQMVISDLENAMAAIDDAINYSEIVMGWSQNEAGQWLYGTEDGYYNDGWHKIGATWFYFNEDGTAKQSEWMLEDGTWYYFNSNCGAACGWAKIDGEWYYFKGNNAMKTGWEKVDGNWYYMASSGKMVTGWCEIGGKWYYFSKESNALGQMLYSTTVDGYTLDENGAWTGE